MPVLAAFIAAIFMSRVSALSVKVGIAFGAALYAVFTFLWSPLHYIHLMFITLASTLLVIALLDRAIGRTPLPVAATP